MATFTTAALGVTFDVKPDTGQSGGEFWRPFWDRDVYIDRRHLAYTSQDDLQYGGLGNPRMTISALVAPDSGSGSGQTTDPFFLADTLRGQIMLQGTLDMTAECGSGWVWTNTYLVGVTKPRRLHLGSTTFIGGVPSDYAMWAVDLSFERLP